MRLHLRCWKKQTRAARCSARAKRASPRSSVTGVRRTDRPDAVGARAVRPDNTARRHFVSWCIGNRGNRTACSVPVAAPARCGPFGGSGRFASRCVSEPSRPAGKRTLKPRPMTWVDLIAVVVLVCVFASLYWARCYRHLIPPSKDGAPELSGGAVWNVVGFLRGASPAT